MRTTLFCSVAGVLLALVLAESSPSTTSAQVKQQHQHQQQKQHNNQQQHHHEKQNQQQQHYVKQNQQLNQKQKPITEEKSAEDKADHDAVAQPATSYSTVVYHDAPQTAPEGGGGSGEGSHSARVTKAAALGDIAAAGAESSASFRLYHPKLEDYMSNMNPALVQNLMKQQPQTFAKIEQHKSESSPGPVAQAATKLLYPPKKYKSVMPGSQQTAFNVGYSIGFGGVGGGGGGGGSDGGGGGGGSRQPHPQALVGHEEVVTGKPKLRVRVEGKNSVWKQLSPNVEMSQHASASSPGRYAFDHDQALGQSNTFDASNAVEDPLQLHQLPLAMPLTFPLPLTAFDNVFLPPPQTSSRGGAALPLAVAPAGQFRTGHSLQLKPSDSPVDAKPLPSLHSVHTLLPQDNMFQATGTLQTADGLTLPAMQHVFVTGADGQMVPAYLIPVAALGAAQPLPPFSQSLPRHPQAVSSFFPHHRPSPPPQRDSYDNQRHERKQQSQQNLVASAASPHQERLKPFRPSQPLGLDGFHISSNPHTHATHHHVVRQRPPYATRSVVTEGGVGGGFKAVESNDQRQVPSSMYVLKPPAPEKTASSEPSFSYQMFDHSNSQPQQSPAPQPPKYRTIVQLRPVQTGGVGGVVSGLIPGLRPSRDLAGEQTVLNAILSQELLRKNSAARNAPIIAQTVYGVRSYR